VIGLLNGIRVLTVEQYGAGPYGTQLLADLGAEVVKIENVETGGDISRSVGPYTLGEHDSEFFQTFNRGKKSVLLDLKSEAGRNTFRKLVGTADAVANNLRGDQPDKLGLTYEALAGENSAIVCAHLSAYGRDNERAGWPGYDYLMQAECGFLHLTGEPDGPPSRFGLSMVDFMTGSLMALALVSGVLKARETGVGCDVDTSLYDTALHQLSYPATWYLNEGHKTERLSRSSHPSVIPSQLFRTRDGWLFVMCQTPRFWELFAGAVGGEAWLTDARFATPDARRSHREALQTLVDEALSLRATAEWIEVLAGTVPVAPVNDVAQALDNPFAEAVGMINSVDYPNRAHGLRMLSGPIRVNGERGAHQRAPLLGEHNDELLS